MALKSAVLALETARANTFGHEIRFLYDGMNNLIEKTDPMGFVTRYEYDALGRKTAETDSVGARTEWVYDARGLVIEVKGSANKNGECGSCGLAKGTTDKPGKYKYNDMRQITQFTDLLGNTIQYDYDDLGYLVAEKDALGHITRFERDINGNVLARHDPDGGVAKFTYNKLNLATTAIDPVGAITQYRYDFEGRRTEIILPDGAKRVRKFDSMGRVILKVDAIGGQTSFVYDPNGNLLEKRDAAGTIAHYRYNEANRLISAQDDVNGIKSLKTYAYDDGGRLSIVTDSMNNSTRHEYDVNGRLKKTVNAMGQETSYEYDEIGRRIRVINAAGNMVNISYNSAGFPASIHDGVKETIYKYDTLGRLIKEKITGSSEIEYIYDASGNNTATRENGRIETRKYDKMNRLIELTYPSGAIVRYAYDLGGRVISRVDGFNNIVKYEYDERGQRIKTILANDTETLYTYDAENRLTSISIGPERKKIFVYDAMGRRTGIQYSDGRKKRFEYDSLGRLLACFNEMDQATRYEYDSLGQRTALIDAKGNRTAWTYDSTGRCSSMIYPNGDREIYVYDGLGNMIEKHTPNGEVLRYQYNPVGKINRIEVEGNVPQIRAMYKAQNDEMPLFLRKDIEEELTKRNFTVEFERDNLGRIITQRGPSGKITTSHDMFGNILSTHNTANESDVRFEYDVSDNLIFLKRRIGGNDNVRQWTTRWDRDFDGKPVSVAEDDHELAQISYDIQRRPTHILLASGELVNYEYGIDGQMENIRITSDHNYIKETERGIKNPNKQQAITVEYRKDATGNISAILLGDATGMYKFSYDQANRLTEELFLDEVGQIKNKVIYEYDETGNRTRLFNNDSMETYTYNNLNQVISRQRTGMDIDNFAYDPNGNLIRMSISNGKDRGSTLVWLWYDPLNRLTRIVSSDGNIYDLDYFGMARQPVSVKSSLVRVAEKYVLESNLMHEREELVASFVDNGEPSRYVYIDHDRPLAKIIGKKIEFFVLDRNNSPIQFDKKKGKFIIPKSKSWNAFGVGLVSPDASKFTQPIFKGKRALYFFSDELRQMGFYDFQSRIYLADLGIFLTRDPLGYDASRIRRVQWNTDALPDGSLYRAFNNNPILYNDKFGLDADDPCDMAGDQAAGNAGGVICYKGTPYPCSFSPGKVGQHGTYIEPFKKCNIEHEKEHIPDIEPCCKDPNNPDYNKPIRAGILSPFGDGAGGIDTQGATKNVRSEAKAYRKSAQCLRDNKNMCEGYATPAQRKECKDWVDGISDLEDELAKECEDAAKKFIDDYNNTGVINPATIIELRCTARVGG